MTVRDIAKMHTQPGRPMGLVLSAWGGTRVEAWMSAEDIATAGAPVVGNVPARKAQNQRSVLYNAMVSPFDRMSVRAMVWYQGEANADQNIAGVDQTDYYATAYQAMIEAGAAARRWATLPSSPCSCRPPSRPARRRRRATPRGAPRSAWRSSGRLRCPGGDTDISGTAVGLDLGGASAWGIDHPPNKNEMSRRLALQSCTSPTPSRAPCGRGPCSLAASWRSSRRHRRRPSCSASTRSWGLGMALRRVHAKNIDGTSNDCTLCCSGDGLPFEVSVDGSQDVGAGAQDGHLHTGKRQQQQEQQQHQHAHPQSVRGGSATPVRSPRSDYVDCVFGRRGRWSPGRTLPARAGWW